MATLEILSQGDEIITGQVVDSNSAWLAQQSIELGFKVTKHTAVGDNLDDLVTTFREISRRADCCLCTGGLGPTTDDLTAEAFAQAFNRPLLFDEVAFTQIQQYFHYRNRPMAECNRKQAMLPKVSIRLDNSLGTAPGFAAKAGVCWFVFMPGVPSEMKNMFAHGVRPLLLRQFSLFPLNLVSIRTIGIGESDLQERLASVTIPDLVQLGFRAEPGEVQVKLLFAIDFPNDEAEALVAKVAQRIGTPVYAIHGLNDASVNLVAIIDQLMLSKALTLTLLESVSHGLVAAKFLGVSWLTKADFVQSPAQLLTSYKNYPNHADLVSTVKMLCHSLQTQQLTQIVLVQLSTADVRLALADGNLVNIATGLMVDGEFYFSERLLSGDRSRKQNQAATAILDLLRCYLQGIELNRLKLVHRHHAIEELSANR